MRKNEVLKLQDVLQFAVNKCLLPYLTINEQQLC